MKRSQLRALLLRLVVISAVVLSFAFQARPGTASAAETAPNTAITNTATATYTDANNISYTTNSNTVTTTVQNAPDLSITKSATQNVSPGEVVTDNFTVTNEGNATGAITLNAPTQTGTATLVTTGYILNGATTGTCSVATPCTLATLNAQTALTAATVGTAITVGVEYTVGSTAAAGSTITTTLTGTIEQAAVGAAPAETSPTATATDTDDVLADARLDLFKTASTPASATADITYTIAGNDGGGFPAQAVNSAGVFLGLGTGHPGIIAVLDKLPTVTGATTQPVLTGAPAVPALPAGATGTVYYSTSTTLPAVWSTTFTASATYIALFVTTSNANGQVFPADPTGSTGAGTAQSASQFTFTFQTTQPTGTGVANPGALSNIANSIIGGNPGLNGTPIIAPGIAPDTDYETTAAPSFPNTTFTPTISNTTASSGTTPPGGASNVVTTQAFATAQALNGPLDSAAATGSYNGVVANSNENDFTAVGFVCSNGAATAVVGATAAVACNWPTTTPVAIPNTISNPGGASDTYNIYASAPAGYTVQLFSVTGCPTAAPAVLPIAPYGTGCTVGAAISPVSASGGSVTTTAGTTIASGGTFNYVAEYAPAAGTTPLPFVPVSFDTIAYGTAATVTAGVPTIGADANETWNVVYPGGPIKVVKSQTIVSNCSGTPAATAGTVCPGGTITYSLVYSNVAPAALATGGTGVTGEPAFALNGLIASGASITDDGTTTWSVNTFGIDASAAPTFPAAAGTPVYSPTTTLSTGTYPAKTTGPAKVVVPINGTIQPGATGTITFQVTVK